MLPDAFMEIYYYLTGKPYFSVMVLSNNRKVKKFIQLASSKVKGEDFFLVSKNLKCAWWKPVTPIIDGLKFVTYVDLNNAIPLLISNENIKYEDSEYYIKETKSITISEDLTKQNKEMKNGVPIKFVKIEFPPTLLYEKVEAHFVKLIMGIPPNKWEEYKWIFIAGFIVLGFIAWQFMNSGGLTKLQG